MDFEDLKELISIVLIFILVFSLIFILVFSLIFIPSFSISVYADYKDMQVFNKYHNTDYTYSEWFWGEETIKDYVEGKEINLNIDK